MNDKASRAAVLLVLLLGWPVPAIGQERPGELDGGLDAEARSQVLERIVRTLRSLYVVPERVPEIEKHLRRRLEAGAYDEAVTPTQLAQALTEDLRQASNGVAMAVVHTSEKERKHPALGTADDASAFHRFEMLPGNVGYLELPNQADLALTRETAVAATELLAKADAVILDMRRNRGGSFSALHLLTSYFLGPHPLKLYSVQGPRTDQMTPQYSLNDLPGKRLTQADVYILTGKRTAAPALVLQQFHRARIVGERTIGAGHIFYFVAVGNGFRLWLPTEELLHSHGRETWEGKSVEPDIAVPADRALDVAHFELVKRLAEKATDAARRRRLGWLLPLLELRAKGAQEVPASLLQHYAGRYGGTEILLEQGHLYLLDAKEARRKLIPLPGEGFLVEDASAPPEKQVRVRFIQDAEGDFNRLQILTPDGRVNWRGRRSLDRLVTAR